MSKKENECTAIMEFYDDNGDGICTFHCQLPKDHEGQHQESGKMYEEFPYLLKWDKDMTETYEVGVGVGVEND